MLNRNPLNHHQTQLVQQLADLDWSVHQIAFMNEVHLQRRDPDADRAGIAKLLIGLGRTLSTLNLYESRKRRAAKEVEAALQARQEADAAMVTGAAASDTGNWV